MVHALFTWEAFFGIRVFHIALIGDFFLSKWWGGILRINSRKVLSAPRRCDLQSFYDSSFCRVDAHASSKHHSHVTGLLYDSMESQKTLAAVI
jgi:hypothetical protein